MTFQFLRITWLRLEDVGAIGCSFGRDGPEVVGLVAPMWKQEVGFSLDSSGSTAAAAKAS